MNLPQRTLIGAGLFLLVVLGAVTLRSMLTRPDPVPRAPSRFYSEELPPGPLPRPEEIGIVLPAEPTPSVSRARPDHSEEGFSGLSEAEVEPAPADGEEDPIRQLEQQGIVVY